MLRVTSHLSYLEVFFITSVKVFPLLDFLLNFLLCLPFFTLCPRLSLCTTDDFFVVIYWDVDELRTAHVVRAVFEETSGHKSAGCVSASENAVTTTRAIGVAPSRNVEDGAVDRKVDRKIWVGPIVDR